MKGDDDGPLLPLELTTEQDLEILFTESVEPVLLYFLLGRGEGRHE